MSKYVTLSVVIEFEDKIYSDNDHNEIAKNVAQAIANEANNGVGIAPENSETFTKTVYVKSVNTDEEFICKVT